MKQNASLRLNICARALGVTHNGVSLLRYLVRESNPVACKFKCGKLHHRNWRRVKLWPDFNLLKMLVTLRNYKQQKVQAA